MAERRMFAKSLIDSDCFLDMSLSAQALYFHLGMRADDDGFIDNPRKILRMINASDDDLKVLMAKKYILAFQTGVIVVRHWKRHNQIKSDRYRPTVHTEEKAMLQLDSGKAYGLVSELEPKCIQSVSELEPQYSIGKVRLDKDSIGGAGENPAPKRKRFTPPTVEEVREFIDVKGYTVDPDRFMDFYTANGWKVGRNSMKDWQATVRSWHRRNQEAIPTSAKTYTPQSYTPIVSHDDSLNMSDVYDM